MRLFSKSFFVSKGSPFIFYFFNVTYNTGRASRVPPLEFFRHCATLFQKFFIVPKGAPFGFFKYFATECMLINPEGSPFYIFRHYATFFERKKFQNFHFFFQKNVLRFLSLRYGADFRRSHLVSPDHRPHTERSTFYRISLALPTLLESNLGCFQRIPPLATMRLIERYFLKKKETKKVFPRNFRFF